MNREEIFEKVKAIVEDMVEDLHRANVQGNSRLKEDLGLDSLDGVDIAMELVKTFGIRTDDKDIDTVFDKTMFDYIIASTAETSLNILTNSINPI